MSRVSIKEMSDQELISRYKSLYDAVFNFECFSASDVQMLVVIGNELERRGYKFVERVEIVKAEEVVK